MLCFGNCCGDNMGHFLTQVKARAEKTCLSCITGSINALKTVKCFSVCLMAGPETWELICLKLSSWLSAYCKPSEPCSLLLEFFSLCLGLSSVMFAVMVLVEDPSGFHKSPCFLWSKTHRSLIVSVTLGGGAFSHSHMCSGMAPCGSVL